LEKLAERRAAVAGNHFCHTWDREPDRLLGQEHGDLLALFGGCATDEECDRYPLGVLESRREVDDNFGSVGHGRASFGSMWCHPTAA